MRTLILTDNPILLPCALALSRESGLPDIDVACSQNTTPACRQIVEAEGLAQIRVKAAVEDLKSRYGLILSLHCKQIFPPALVQSVRCINFHPGYNPYNRGWYPHVFSMNNGLPAGLTIHEMDAQIDHGNIIYEEQIRIAPHEVSGEVYGRILAREIELLAEWLPRLIRHEYETFAPSGEGNYNGIRDFEALKRIDLSKTGTAGEFIDYLRSMTFEGYRNAYFEDPQTGKRCFVEIRITPEESV
jgi:methionyl-tRNA formyltransferase